MISYILLMIEIWVQLWHHKLFKNNFRKFIIRVYLICIFVRLKGFFKKKKKNLNYVKRVWNWRTTCDPPSHLKVFLVACYSNQQDENKYYKPTIYIYISITIPSSQISYEAKRIYQIETTLFFHCQLYHVRWIDLNSLYYTILIFKV